jgi:hypothetical protein
MKRLLCYSAIRKKFYRRQKFHLVMRNEREKVNVYQSENRVRNIQINDS